MIVICPPLYRHGLRLIILFFYFFISFFSSPPSPLAQYNILGSIRCTISPLSFFFFLLYIYIYTFFFFLIYIFHYPFFFFFSYLIFLFFSSIFCAYIVRVTRNPKITDTQLLLVRFFFFLYKNDNKLAPPLSQTISSRRPIHIYIYMYVTSITIFRLDDTLALMIT